MRLRVLAASAAGLAVAAAGLAVAGASSATATATPASAVPGIEGLAARPAADVARTGGSSTAATRGVGGCSVFPHDNYWNTDISKLPVDPRSKEWLKHMSPRSDLHPDFGPSYGAQPVPYGIPITVVGAGHPKVHVSFQYASESDKARYPLGRDTLIEGGRGAGGDRHAIVVDMANCTLYETWSTSIATVTGTPAPGRSGSWAATS